MVAEKKQTGQSKGAAPQSPPVPPAEPPAGEKTGGAEQQGQPPAEGGSVKRKPWIKRTPTEIVMEQVRKQEQKVEELKKELTKEEGELQKLRKATELLGGS
ncbi:MAG TPA: hypothetical protein VFR24_17275 [Candidatus Angelobacter sp.]|nr:hypothetical protein [Candidatus Angelobacter sp.]